MSTGTTIAIICFAVAAAVVLIALLWALVQPLPRRLLAHSPSMLRRAQPSDFTSSKPTR